jgi:branched-chain amino acid transport system ATP-binding protein
VEQELEVALALASRCYVLDQGRIQFEGPAEALRRDHAIQARFLGAT